MFSKPPLRLSSSHLASRTDESSPVRASLPGGCGRFQNIYSVFEKGESQGRTV
jgi:hypothetical protein